MKNEAYAVIDPDGDLRFAAITESTCEGWLSAKTMFDPSWAGTKIKKIQYKIIFEE